MNTYVIIYITGKQWNKITVRCSSQAPVNTLDILLLILVHPPHFPIHPEWFSILVKSMLSLQLQSWSSNSVSSRGSTHHPWFAFKYISWRNILLFHSFSLLLCSGFQHIVWCFRKIVSVFHLLECLGSRKPKKTPALQILCVGPYLPLLLTAFCQTSERLSCHILTSHLFLCDIFGVEDDYF